MKTLFEDETMKIYMNPTNEPFILNKKTGVTLRFDVNRHNTLVTFDNARVSPTSIGGLPAFTFSKG
jgi:hypothetical protein